MKRTIWQQFKDNSSSSDDNDSYRGWNSACCSPHVHGTASNAPAPFAATSSMSVVSASNVRPHASTDLTHGEKLLADEMKQLSLNERETVFEDIHGVVTVKQETPELLQSSLTKLDECISALRRNREGYDKACFMNPAFTKSHELKVMFLRATQFNASEAAKRICEHFDVKHRLFGLERIARDITWDDLPDDAKQSLENGAYQIFADWKDRSGRAVSCDVWANWRYKTVESQVKAMWWISMHAMRDMYRNNHNMGIILIPFTLGLPPNATSYYMRAAALSQYKIGTCFPIRVSGFHGCFPNDSLRPLFSALMAVLPTEIRLRTKMHFGSLLEVQYALSSFGIDASFVDLVLSYDSPDSRRFHIDQVNCSNSNSNSNSKKSRGGVGPLCVTTNERSTAPATTRGVSDRMDSSNSQDSDEAQDYAASQTTLANLRALRQRLAVLREREEAHKQYVQQHEADIIRFPAINDVVLGRGVPYQKFPGNIALTKLLEQDLESYINAATRKEKARITQMILDRINAEGRRFVKRDPSGEFWTVVEAETSRQKIAMGYRNLARRSRESGSDKKPKRRRQTDGPPASVMSDGTSLEDSTH